MLPIAATVVRSAMEGHHHETDVTAARRELDAELTRLRERARRLESAVTVLEHATADGLRAARNEGERIETLRASALHARNLRAEPA
jgi:uncharacterized protein YlxW (UPF0749 family)